MSEKGRDCAGVPLASMFEDSVDEVAQKRSHRLTQEQSSRGIGREVTGCECLDIGSKYAETLC